MVRRSDIARELLADKGLLIGSRTAAEVASTLLSSAALEDDVRAEVRGRDVYGNPSTAVVTSRELRDAVRRSRPRR